jgi:hypothetical protein
MRRVSLGPIGGVDRDESDETKIFVCELESQPDGAFGD